MNTYRWIIKTWEHGPFLPGLLQTGAELLMLHEEGSAECTLVWADAGAGLWWIDSLPINRTATVPVHFGPLTGSCEITLTLALDGKTLNGILKPGNDGNAGTFAAEGNGPPPPDPGE